MKYRKKLLIGLGVALLVVTIAYLLVEQPWFRITFAVALVETMNVICGLIGACLIYSRFFKRPMNLETIGVWAMIVLAGFGVLLFGMNYKPKFITY